MYIKKLRWTIFALCKILHSRLTVPFQLPETAADFALCFYSYTAKKFLCFCKLFLIFRLTQVSFF